MKNKIYFFALLVNINFAAFAQAPVWQWAQGAGYTDDQVAYSIAVDALGNSYITGYFYADSMTFGSITISNTYPATTDAFVAKYNPAGNIVWAIDLGGAGYSGGGGIALDANANVYVAGGFSGILTVGAISLGSQGSSDMFIAKFDSSGTAIWATSAGGNGDEGAISVKADPAGNTYLVGAFSSNTFYVGATQLTNSTLVAGTRDVFVAKYDAAGNAVWARSAAGDYDDNPNDLALSANGNLFVTGWYYSPTLTFGTTVLTNASATSDIFIAKYDTSGSLLWANGEGGTDAEFAYGVSADASGNAYLTGHFAGDSLTFGSTTLLNASIFDYDLFLTKYDSNGNVTWAKSAGSTGGEYGYAAATDANGNSYITGTFNSPTLTFGSTVLTNAGGADVYVTKYDTSGNVVWATSGGSAGVEFGRALAFDASGSVYVTGTFGTPAATFGNYTLTNLGTGFSTDVFVAKLQNTTGMTEQNNPVNALIVFPNPSLTTASVKFSSDTSGSATIALIDMYGEKVFSKEINTVKGANVLSIDVSKIATGVYAVQLNNTMEKFFTTMVVK